MLCVDSTLWVKCPLPLLTILLILHILLLNSVNKFKNFVSQKHWLYLPDSVIRIFCQ